MSRHENLEVAQRFLKSFGNAAALRDVLAPDVVWHVPGRSPISGAHRGVDGVLAYFGALRERSGGTFHGAPLDVLAGEKGVIVLMHATGTRDGRAAYDSTYALHLAIAGGIVTGARLYNEDQAAFEAFWA